MMQWQERQAFPSEFSLFILGLEPPLDALTSFERFQELFESGEMNKEKIMEILNNACDKDMEFRKEIHGSRQRKLAHLALMKTRL